MRKTLLLSAVLLAWLNGYSQSNFHKLMVGAGAGGAIAFADLRHKTLTFAAYGTLDYLFTPYLSLGIEGQKGQLAGGNKNTDPGHRQFVNSYLSASANLKLSVGEFLSERSRRVPALNFLSGIYAGIGLGAIHNRVSNVRYDQNTFYPGLNASTEVVVPVNAGYNFVLHDRWGYRRYGINLNVQTSFGIEEGMDGYAQTNGRPDFYTFISAGIRYHFGMIGVDRRR